MPNKEYLLTTFSTCYEFCLYIHFSLISTMTIYYFCPKKYCIYFLKKNNSHLILRCEVQFHSHPSLPPLTGGSWSLSPAWQGLGSNSEISLPAHLSYDHSSVSYLISENPFTACLSMNKASPAENCPHLPL